MNEFLKLGLDPTVLSNVEAAGYKIPTPIQNQAIPPALLGRDVLGIAQTGTGKTASFVLPMINALIQGRARARMPRSLVLAPTRELATQVGDSFAKYSENSKLSMALLIGGVSFSDQFSLIDKGVDVLIATPGRLLDHFERGRLLLNGVQIVTVDEADRMLDMGFIPDIERIFKLTPFTRQTLFFSATMPPEIERLTNEFLSNPARVEVTRQASIGDNISQFAARFKFNNRKSEFKDKRQLLRDTIKSLQDKITNGIIFCNRKSDVDILMRSMRAHKINCVAIHGDLNQSIRTKVLNEFRQGDKQFLIASDVAARGLDIPNVSHVFNFDIPVNPEDYVHRIGRTGRAGRPGVAITLASDKENKGLEVIESLVKSQIKLLEFTDNVEDKPKENNPRNHQSISRQQKPFAQKERLENNSPAKEASKNDIKRNAPIVGMGDHVPAFLKRNLSKQPLA